jgi:hypothetical protein
MVLHRIFVARVRGLTAPDLAHGKENEMREFEYIATVFADYVNVREGRKPLLIVSAGKSQFAADSLLDIAREDGLSAIYEPLVCEDGELHMHVIIAAKGAPYAREARDLIVDCLSEAVLTRDPARKRELRAQLQLKLGLLLGYSAGECVDFINSDLGRTCPCDCCGSEYTVTQAPDRHASRLFW